jgi:hypothetical protein
VLVCRFQHPNPVFSFLIKFVVSLNFHSFYSPALLFHCILLHTTLPIGWMKLRVSKCSSTVLPTTRDWCADTHLGTWKWTRPKHAAGGVLGRLWSNHAGVAGQSQMSEPRTLWSLRLFQFSLCLNDFARSRCYALQYLTTYFILSDYISKWPPTWSPVNISSEERV